MSHAELMEIAEKAARQRLLVRSLGMMNRPDDIETQIKMDANFMIEEDKLRIFEDSYRVALGQWIAK